MAEPAKSPVELLEKQTVLLENLRDDVSELRDQLEESNAIQERQIHLLGSVARAANLYFFLTVIALVVGAIVFAAQLTFILRLLSSFSSLYPH